MLHGGHAPLNLKRKKLWKGQSILLGYAKKPVLKTVMVEESIDGIITRAWYTAYMEYNYA